MDKEEVKKLADLVRLEVADDEADSLAKEIDSILSYVKQIEDMPSAGILEMDLPKNIMREDSDAHPSGEYTEAILSNAPSRETDFVKVKKILG